MAEEELINNPWLDPQFSKIKPFGTEPGFYVEDIPERLGILAGQLSREIILSESKLVDLKDTPEGYGIPEQFLQTDGEGNTYWGWPYWTKSSSAIYYKTGNVGVGAFPRTHFHVSKPGNRTVVSRVTAQERPWRHWESLDTDDGFAMGIQKNTASAKFFRINYDSPIGTGSKTFVELDAINNRIGFFVTNPVCLLHGREAVCTDYTGVHPDVMLLLENNDNTYIQLQGATTGAAGILFADDDYNPPAGLVKYNFNTDKLEFGAVAGTRMYLDATTVRQDSATLSRFVADAHDADAYFEWQEDGVLKWTAGLDFTDSLIFKIGEGIPGTNTVVEIPSGSGSIHFVRAADKGFQYLDTGSSKRWMMRVANATNVVEILNRAANGVVQIHANTSTAGAAGDVLVATFEDDIITFAQALTLSTIAAGGSDYDKFLVSDTGVVKYRTGAQVLSDISGQPLDAELTAIAGLTSAAGKMIEFTGSGTAQVITVTAAGKALMDDAAASNQRTTLGLVIGTDVLAQQTIGIADDNLVEIDHAAVVDNDYAKFTVNGLKGRSYSEVLSDIGGAAKGANSDITSMSGITGTIATPTNLASKTTATWNKSIGSGGDYADWATMIVAMPNLIAHAVTVTIKTGTTLSEICNLRNKSGLTTDASIIIKAEKYTTGAIQTADSATATTLRDTSVFDTNDEWNSCWVLIVDGTGTDNGFIAITDTDGTNGDIIVSSWPGTQPDNTSRYLIVGALIDSSGTYGFDIRYNNLQMRFYGIGIKDSTSYNVHIENNKFVQFNNCGLDNAALAGLNCSENTLVDCLYCGFTQNNSGNTADYGGVRARYNNYLTVRYSGLSDNNRYGIILSSQNANIVGNFGDGNGVWGTYAQASSQADISGAECSGSSGNHSDPGTAGTANADQAAAY